MPKNIARTALLIALVLFASSTNAVTAGDGPKAPSKEPTPAGAAKCEEGRSWCAKRAECIKSGTPCRYLHSDPLSATPFRH
jgi:hypothetical protein